jgi:hypothetical protein
MPKTWRVIILIWFISIFVGGLWGLFSISGFTAARMIEWAIQHSLTVQAISVALQALFTLILIGLTVAYVIFTNRLRQATDTLATLAGEQSKLTAAGQRAYLSVEPLGIALKVAGDSLLGHVSIRNAGHLPAHQVGWFVTIDKSIDGLKRDFPVGDAHGTVVAPPGVRMPRGSRVGLQIQDLLQECGADSGLPRGKQTEVFIYVWGIVHYQDGLGNPRWTRFCHRYNWIMRSDVSGEYNVDKKYARFHEYGNGTDESASA